MSLEVVGMYLFAGLRKCLFEILMTGIYSLFFSLCPSLTSVCLSAYSGACFPSDVLVLPSSEEASLLELCKEQEEQKEHR